jgi:hypothetical protein
MAEAVDKRVRNLAREPGPKGSRYRAWGRRTLGIFEQNDYNPPRANSALLANLDPIAPKDPQFQEAFATATISSAQLARYYIRSLEMKAKAERYPFYLPNDDAQIITLEHVLPRNPEGNWPQFSREEAEAFHRRLGNLALLHAKGNSDLKSLPFTEKKAIYADAQYMLTRQIATLNDWTPETISARQREMARLALQTWPLSAE